MKESLFCFCHVQEIPLQGYAGGAVLVLVQ